MLDTQVLLDPPARHARLLPTPFACLWTHAGDDAVWVRVAGELDIATSPRLGRALSEARRQARVIVVDLRRVAFLDSSAIHTLLLADTRARRENRRLVILRGPAQVDRIFALSGVCQALEFVELDAVEPPVMALLRLAAESD